MKKHLPLIGVIAVALLISVVVLMGANIGGIIKAAAESYGPRFTGSKVTLASIDTSFFGGDITAKDIFIGNPKGFQSAYALKADRVIFVLDTGTIADQVVHIKEITMDGPELIYEAGSGTSNLQAIRANILKAAGGVSVPSSPLPIRKVIIDVITVRNAKLAVWGASPKKGAKPLPTINLSFRDIGKASGGASAGEAAILITDKALKAVESVVARGTRRNDP